jgi:hypothetical protein
MEEKNNDKKTEDKSNKRHRSPGFPIISLEEAISRLKIIYQHDRRAFTTAEAIISHLGYKGNRGGTAGRAVAALKHYGLLDEKAGQFRVSDLGFKLLHLPEDSQEKKEIIKDMALAPSLFKRVFSYYDGELPSNTTLKSHLILNERFNPDSVDQFIRVLRQTISFANPNLEGNENLENLEDVKDEELDIQKSQAQQSEIETHSIPQKQSLTSLYPDGETLKFRISRNSEVSVIFSGRVTQEAIEKLKILLEATKDTYPTQGELEKPKSAIWKNGDFDQPVQVVGELGKGGDGRDYVKIEGSESGIPLDEIDFGEN